MPKNAGLVAVLAMALLWFTAPVSGAEARVASAQPASAQAATDRDWSARPIGSISGAAAGRLSLTGLPGSTLVGIHPLTGRVRLISGTPGHPLTPASIATAAGPTRASDASSAARAFMRRYGRAFGLQRQASDLRLGSVRSSRESSTSVAGLGRPISVVRFDQVRDGLPVLGGQVVVQVGAGGEVISASGEVLPRRAKAAHRPRVTEAQARRTAAAWLARESGRPTSAIETRAEGLVIHDARLTGEPALGPGGPRLAWSIDSIDTDEGNLIAHRLVLVDAAAGHVITTIDRTAELDRRICDARNSARKAHCRRPFTRREGKPPVGIGDVDALYRLIATVDELYRDRFGRDGVDDNGARYKATVRYCQAGGCPLNNAYWHWKDQQALFGRGWSVADDVVGHELTHAVLDHEASLFYHFQSGAINESLADIFGEAVDLTDGTGRDTAWTRWKIGEDTPIGPFRDMRSPTTRGHPDRVRSPLWHTSAYDDGGVHRNSGVGNKAATLIIDGGTFNGVTVAGIGLNRALRIYYRAMTARLTSASDYIDLADALLGACTDLAGSGGITFADCRSVERATQATQMDLAPLAGGPRAAPTCAVGRFAVDAFADDLEDPDLGLWRPARLVGKFKGWFYPPTPNNDPKLLAQWASSGVLNLYAADRSRRTDTVMRLTTAVDLPARAWLRFEHGFAFDVSGKRRYDGGIVEISVDDGPWRGVNSLFSHGGYKGQIVKGRGNPLGGRRAFTGFSRGWGSSRIDLSDLEGQSLRLRFRVGTDRRIGGLGWFIDDVRIYSCARDVEPPTGSVELNGGAATTSDPRVSVAIESGDALSSVTRMRISNSGTMADGLLARGLGMEPRASLSWDVTNQEWGGTAGTGDKRVWVQLRDGAGNWSAPFSDGIELLP